MDSFKDTHDASLSLWQQQNFILKGKCTPPVKAQCHLSNFIQLSSDQSALGENDLFAEYRIEKELRNYGNVIDESDPASGLDNFAQEALSLAANVETVNESWTSGLSETSIFELPFIKDCINRHDPWQDKVTNESTKMILSKKAFSPQAQQGKFSFKKFPAKSPTNYVGKSKPPRYNNDDDDSDNDVTEVSRPVPTSRFGKKRKTELDPREKEECFRSARDQLAIDEALKGNRRNGNTGGQKKSLGSRPRGQCYSKFIPPNRGKDEEEEMDAESIKETEPEPEHPKLKGMDPALIELIKSEIMDHGSPIDWNDIAGLEYAKSTIKEIVIWPMLRPDLFTGLRGPPKGILLFGPPGTGKTLIGKCIASQSKATFFSISASSLTSKWIGQGEKMVRALFAVAEINQPAVIFIDEIDSLLSQRSDTEHESSRRIKTEFLIHLDGATTSSDDRILVVGATNRPQEIDEAARRRLVKRLYIPLPEADARKQIISKLLQKQTSELSEEELASVVKRTDGYSGADVTNLCKEAALGPIRSLRNMDIASVSKDDVRPIQLCDFQSALQHVKSSVSRDDLTLYLEWNRQYGCGSI